MDVPAVEISATLPARVPSYYDAEPPTVVFSAEWRDAASWAEQREHLARELAHWALGATYSRRPQGLDYWTARRLEERGRRLALRTLVSDVALIRAAATGAQEAWEIAELLDRSPAWVAQRVELFFVRQPGWLPVLRPR